MDYRKLASSAIDALWTLQKQYKKEIGEDEPTDEDKERLAEAIDKGTISFYGVWEENTLIGCCSVTVGFSTFNYSPCGVLEDFYICPEYRHQGIGSIVVTECEKWATELGYGKAIVESRDNKVEFYEKLGYKATGELISGETFRCIRMEKEL